MNLRWSARLLVVLLIFAAHPSPVGADARVENFMKAQTASPIEGQQVFAYDTGTEHHYDTTTEFDTGTTTGATVVQNGSVEIDLDAADWWDKQWQHRQCFTVKGSVALGQYPFRIIADTSAASADDIRVVEALSPASSATALPSYTESGVGTAMTVIWFQGESAAAGKEYCVYFDADPTQASVSDQFAPFTFTNGQTVSYYTMLDTYRAAGVDSRVTVVSYTDANTVSDGTTTVVLNTGGTVTFSRLDEQSIVTATGPIDATYDRGSKEALIPEGFADSRFSFPTTRYSERFWVRSPHGTTDIQAISNGVVLSTTTVTPAMGAVQIIAAAPGGRYVSLSSTTGHDFLAIHSATNDQDIGIGVPWFGDSLYGVASNNLNFGSTSATTAAWIRSNGASGTANVIVNGMTVIGGNGAYGSGRAYRVTGAGYVAAWQQADNDGTEVTSFLPERLLSETFRLPVTSRYISFACPTPGTTITRNGGAVYTCNGVGVGHLRLLNQAAGTLFEASAPVFAYHETARDEHNIFGAKASIPYNPNASAAMAVEGLPEPCGTWTSPVFPTSGPMGLASIDITLDPGETYTYQISFDGGLFLGPDGTAATSFSDRDIVPYAADSASTAQIQVSFCGETSHLDSVSFECDLDEVSAPLAGSNVVTVVADTPLLRVYPTLDQAFVELISATTPDSYSLETDRSTSQIVAVSGTVTNPAVVFLAQPYSIWFEGVSVQTGSLDAYLVDELTDTRTDTRVQFVF